MGEGREGAEKRALPDVKIKSWIDFGGEGGVEGMSILFVCLLVRGNMIPAIAYFD